MRFLIGICTGTILTLFIATAVDAPTQTTLARATETLRGVWDALIDKTSDSLFVPRDAADGVPPDLLARSEMPASADGEGQPLSRAAEPVAALAPPPELPPPTPVRTIIEVPASAAIEPEVEDPPPVHGMPDLPGGSAEWDVQLAGSQLDIATDPGNTADVWTPFHSQMSAEGFAARLSRALDHDFRVERQGAGAYQVVFDATSTAERDALLTEIAEITGQ